MTNLRATTRPRRRAANRMPGRLAACALAALATAAAAAPGPLIEQRGELVLDGVPAAPPALAARLGEYLSGRQASFLDWLPDGGMLIATRFGDTEQLHRVAAPLAAREQITWYPEPVSGAHVAKVATAPGIAFLKDSGGDENAQIWFRRFTEPGAHLVTDGKSLHGSVQWSHDGRRIAFYGTARDGVSYDVYVAEPEAGAPPRLLVAADKATWYPLDWSPDDSKLLLWDYVSIAQSTLWIADVASGALTQVDPPGEHEQVGIAAARFAPDGRGVYIVSDRGGEFRQLRYYDTVTRQSRAVGPDLPWDVSAFDVSADGRYIAWTTNVEGVSRLAAIDTVQHSDLVVPPLPAGVIGSVRFDRTGRRLGFSLSSADSPRDAWAWDLEHGTMERWTRSESGPLDARRFVTPQLVRYPSWDRVNGRARQIPAFVYRPRAGDPAAAGPRPVFIELHGGPESQYRPVFDPWIQFLVNELGFIVVAPNVRGSEGYGKSYLRLDDGALREDAVRDVGSLLVWAGLQPGFDRDRVFVEGGSYGGYLALATLAAYGDRLRGAIDVVGISNFVTFLERTAAYRRDLRRAEYGDERDPRMRAYLQRISPLTNAASIRKPVLVVAGVNDPRVPLSESTQLVYTVRSRGGEVWFLSARNEGHGFRRQSNRDAYLETAANFLERYSK